MCTLLLVKDAAMAATPKNATAEKYSRKRLKLRELVRITETQPMMLAIPVSIKKGSLALTNFGFATSMLLMLYKEVYLLIQIQQYLAIQHFIS